MVKNHTLQDLLSNKQVCHSCSIVDVLTSINERVCEALDKKSEARVVALHISKAFHMVLHGGFFFQS